ncbi:Ketol-acid reductoisomerase [Serinicoccus hydrothermalis]|uniref:Ketol-acid reductoisomerase n=1 Tax=Serinicoccus hydrothermalis TaxID=1758689 RepID=A0A1B1NAX9_9MICO|nr:hypothetical protein [Serinicoccus hydrothermalis]ANS78587.1 Ketol-acid reductoisomerase [Serinicoccus hydrothermalis]
MTTLDPDSADLTLLQDRQVAVLGFDAVGAAHALNLRDSGVDVWVGTDPASRLAARAEIEGLPVVAPEEAAARCDILLVPGSASSERDGDGVQRLVDEHCEPGDLVVVTGADAVSAGRLTVPEGVDLALLRAIGDGDRVREEYLDGRGCPALVAVEHDRSGAAWATLTAYAAAMGALRSGAVVTTLEHVARADRVARDRIQTQMQKALESAYDGLATQGVEPEVAYVALVHELKTRVDQVYSAGFGGTHPLEQAGRTVREMTSWLR